MSDVFDGSTSSNIKYDSLVLFAVKAVFHEYNVSHAVSFHSTNVRADSDAEMYRDVFDQDTNNNADADGNNNNNKISFFNMDGTMNVSHREQIMSDIIEFSRSIVTN